MPKPKKPMALPNRSGMNYGQVVLDIRDQAIQLGKQIHYIQLPYSWWLGLLGECGQHFSTKELTYADIEIRYGFNTMIIEYYD